MEQAFLQDEINYLEEELDHLRSEQRHRWKIVMNIISRFDGLRLSAYLSKKECKERASIQRKQYDHLKRLKQVRFGSIAGQYDNIFNLARLELSTMEKEILSRGLKFGFRKKSVAKKFLQNSKHFTGN